MRRFAVTVLALFLAGGPSFAQPVLTVMSFNIRYGSASDGPNSWDQRKDVLINAIKHFDPDIIGTQECLEFQAEYIVQALPEYRWFGVGRDADGTGEHMAVFYKKNTLSPIETGNFWLSKTPDVPGSSDWNSACNRMVTWAKFHHPSSGRLFHFFNTHFDHRSAEARENAARILAQRAGAAGTGYVIVTGDFNAAAGGSEPWKTLTGAGFRDAWLETATRVGPAVTFNNFGPPQEGAERRIDWILVRGGLKAKRCETSVYNEDGRYPSDHLPVVAVIAFAE